MKKKLLIASLLVAMLCAALFYMTSRKDRIDPHQQITLIDGRKITFKDLQGKPLLVVFWATSCTTCVQEMPKLAKQYEKGTFEVLAIAPQYDDENKIKNFIKQNSYQFKFVYDREKILSNLFEGTVLTPTIYNIDQNGYIKSKHIGNIEFS